MSETEATMEEQNTYPLILAGGSGSRVWPMSSDHASKIFVDATGEGESMFQVTVNRMVELGFNRMFVSVSSQHHDLAKILVEDMNQPSLDIIWLVENRPLGTSGAVLSACRFADEDLDRDVTFFVTPADLEIEDLDELDAAIGRGLNTIRHSTNNAVVQFGVNLPEVRTDLGVILYDDTRKTDAKGVFFTETFVEKPREDWMRWSDLLDEHLTRLYNSGMYLLSSEGVCFSAGDVVPDLWNAACSIDIDFLISLDRTFGRVAEVNISPSMEWSDQEPSFDRGYATHACDKDMLFVTELQGGWSDLGTWSSIYDAAAQQNSISGNVRYSNVTRSLIHNYTDQLMSVDGVEDLVIVAGKNGILIHNRDSIDDDEIRQLAREANTGGRYEEDADYASRPWGSFYTHDGDDSFQLKTLVVDSGQRTSLQSHMHRDEYLVTVRGYGSVTVGTETVDVWRGIEVRIPAGYRHRITNNGSEPLIMSETQIRMEPVQGEFDGDWEGDIIRYQDDYGRQIDDA